MHAFVFDDDIEGGKMNKNNKLIANALPDITCTGYKVSISACDPANSLT